MRSTLSRQPSAAADIWLCSVLEATSTPFSSLKTFVLPYTEAETISESLSPPTSSESTKPTSPVPIDLENPTPSSTAELPVPYAVEFLAEILEEELAAAGSNGAGAQLKAAQALYSTLATELDPIRQRYVSVFVPGAKF